MKSLKNKNRAEGLVDRFDQGEDVSKDFNFNAGTKTVNVDLPIWAIKALDQEATRRGVARQALIKMWLIDRIDVIHQKEAS